MTMKKNGRIWLPYIIGALIGVFAYYAVDYYRHEQRIKREQEVIESVDFEEELYSSGFEKLDTNPEEDLRKWQLKRAQE